MELALHTFARYMYTMVVVFILARFLYYRYQGKKELLFTYILLSAIICLLCILISRVEISLGFALGIFAIFGIVRYRTTQVSPREMTYLFLSAGTAAKNILAPESMEFWRIVFSDVTILIMASIAEYYLFRDKTVTKLLVYDNIENIHPKRKEELKGDLQQRFGISNVKKIEIGKIDAPKKSVTMNIEFTPSPDSNF